MSKARIQSLETIKFLIDRHLRQFGARCPKCGYEGIVCFDRKDNRPYCIKLQLQDMKNQCGRFELDYIKPLSKGGKNSPDNIQLLCRRCNRSKGAKWPAEE